MSPYVRDIVKVQLTPKTGPRAKVDNRWQKEARGGPKLITKKRRQYDAQYKFRVALEAAKGNKTISELASETGIHPNQIGAWKRQLLEQGILPPLEVEPPIRHN